MIQHSTSALEERWLNRRFQWFPFHISSLLSLKYQVSYREMKMPNSFRCWRLWRFVLLEQVVFLKRFPQCTYNSVQYAAIENRSEAWSWDSESYFFDQERGSLQSCSWIQDHRILSHLTRNLLCFVNPEFEPSSDSRSLDSSVVAQMILHFLLVSFAQPLRNMFFHQFLGKLLHDSLGSRRFLSSNSPCKLISSLWAWSACWLAWLNRNRWDSNSWLISWKGFHISLFPNSSPPSPPQPDTTFADPLSLPEWPSQHSVQVSFGNACTKVNSRSLLALDCERKKRRCNRFSVQLVPQFPDG